MLVSQILKSKANADVLTISPDALVSDAALELSTRKIGSLVVSSGNGRAEGILSERDIVRELGKRGGACLNDKVSAMMTRNLVTCTANDNAETVLSKMTEGRFRHMPVMEGDTMVGLITIGDVVKARLAQVSMEKEALEGMIMGH
jgi:CBS domain-containing protein